MSKKMMLLALAVAAMCAFPSAASAQEIHFSGVTTFSGTGKASSFVVANEPKISCTSTTASGSFNAGSSTTGTTSLTFSGCTAEFLGIKGNCNTAGDNAGIVASSATFHLITISTKVTGILMTPVTTTILCVGFSRIEITGNGLIGTIGQPNCGELHTNMTIVFETSGSIQKHLTYTGKTFDLSAHTENSAGVTSGASGTAALEGTMLLESGPAGTLECT